MFPKEADPLPSDSAGILGWLQRGGVVELPANLVSLSWGPVSCVFLHPSGRFNGKTAKSHRRHGLEGIRVANTSGTLQWIFSNCFGWFTDAVLKGKPSVAVGGSLGGFSAVGFRFRCVTQGFAN